MQDIFVQNAQGFEYILEKHGGTARWVFGGTFSQKSRFGHLLPPKKERLGRSAWAFWNFDRFLIYHIIITIIHYHYYYIIIIIIIINHYLYFFGHLKL